MSLPVTVDQVNEFLAAELPFCAEFGITCASLALGESVMHWRHDRRWTRPGEDKEFVCGPVMMTLADVGIYVAIFTLSGIVRIALTNELKTNFLRPAFDRDLRCRARIVKAGRRLSYGVADIYHPDDESRLVAQATSTYVMPGA